MERILAHFPALTDLQQTQLKTLAAATFEWNGMVNLISRKDIDMLIPHHILHSMAIAKFMTFSPGSDVLDLGTGGGLPGLPLAILFPETNFTLIDARGKKIKAVNDIASQIGLKNVQAYHARAEEFHASDNYTGKFDFIITRAVASLDQLFAWTTRLISNTERNGIPNGMVILKGGDIQKELKPLKSLAYHEVQPISAYFDDPYFEDKFVVYLQF